MLIIGLALFMLILVAMHGMVILRLVIYTTIVCLTIDILSVYMIR